MIPNFANKEIIINENDAHCDIYRNFLDKKYCTNLLHYLIQNIDWSKNLTNQVRNNRLSYTMGNRGVIHSYNGRGKLLEPWLPIIEEFKEMFNNMFSTQINSAFINYYRNGNDYISYHSDRECKPLLYMVICISLGETRDFHFKRKTDDYVFKTKIGNGDMMIMYGRCQELFLHSVPARTGKIHTNLKDRISITFREL